MFRKFNYFILSILIITLFLSIIPKNALADDCNGEYREVRGAYGGNYSDSDVWQFVNYLKNNKNYTVSGPYVYGSCKPYTLYWAKDQDVLYWSGHGYSNGKLSYNSGKNTFYGPEKVGIIWTNYDPDSNTTNSAWNTDIEWVIFAACSQMTNPARTKWAKTMLGTAHQVHSISGYDGTAPGDGYQRGGDNSVLVKFFANEEAGNSIRYSWKVANEYNYRNNWGVLTHYGNRYDRICGFPGNRYPNPVPGQTPNIRYCYSGNPDPGISQPLSSKISLLDNKDKKINLQTELTKSLVDEYRAVKGLKIDLDSELLKNKFFKGITDIKVIKKDDRVEYYKDQKSLEIDENNYIFAVAREILYEDGIKVNKNKAKQIAKKYIKEILGMPDNAKLIQTRYVVDYKVDLINSDENKEKSTEQILAYIFEFGQEIEGIPMSLKDGGNKIEVEVDSEGVTFAFKNWNEIFIDETIEKKKLITSKEAIDKFVEYIKSKDIPLDDNILNIVKIDLVYSNSTTGDKLLFNPVWEIECDNHLIIQVDAFDGKIYDPYFGS